MPTTEVNAARAAQLIFMPGFTTARAGLGPVRPWHWHGRGALRSAGPGGADRDLHRTGPGLGVRAGAATDHGRDPGGHAARGRFCPWAYPPAWWRWCAAAPGRELEAAYHSGKLVQADGSQLPFYWAGAVWSNRPRSTDSTGGKPGR